MRGSHGEQQKGDRCSPRQPMETLLIFRAPSEVGLAAEHAMVESWKENIQAIRGSYCKWWRLRRCMVSLFMGKELF